jgi:hypothetical protein
VQWINNLQNVLRAIAPGCATPETHRVTRTDAQCFRQSNIDPCANVASTPTTEIIYLVFHSEHSGLAVTVILASS